MTNLIDALHIPDTQSARDDRHLAIQRVGVRGVRYPIQLRIEGAIVPTVADWSLVEKYRFGSRTASGTGTNPVRWCRRPVTAGRSTCGRTAPFSAAELPLWFSSRWRLRLTTGTASTP